MAIRPVHRKRGVRLEDLPPLPYKESAPRMILPPWKVEQRMSGAQTAAFVRKHNLPPSVNTKPFVPIKNIDEYITALKREGFYSDDEIAEIEKKHRERMKDYIPKPLWVPRVESEDDVYVKLVVGNTKVKVIAFSPYAPIHRWNAENPGKPVPIEVRAEHLLLLGMPKDMVMKMIKKHEKSQKKELKPVKKGAPVFT